MIHVNGVKYEVQVNGQGFPVMMLHGFTGSLHTWRRFSSQYQDIFQFVLPSILGHGKTESPEEISRYHIETVAADLVEILDRLKIEKVHLVGYSMGGRLAIAFAMKYPNRIKSLVLESASAGIASKKERQKRQESDGKLALKIEQEGIESFVSHWEKLSLFLPMEEKLDFPGRLRLRTERLSHKPVGLARSLMGMGTGSQPYYMDKLHRVHLPVLILTGEKDEKFCKIGEEMVQHFPNGRHVIVENSGHVIHLEQPTIFDKIVVDFMMKVEEN